MSARRLSPFAAIACLVALAVIAFLTLNPGWIVGPLRGAFVGELFALTGGRGIGLDLERALNTALFVPLGAAVAAVLPRRWALTGLLAGFVVSAGVESVQAIVPGRVSDPADIVWNTAGAGLGALAVFLVRLLLPARPPARRR